MPPPPPPPCPVIPGVLSSYDRSSPLACWVEDLVRWPRRHKPPFNPPFKTAHGTLAKMT